MELQSGLKITYVKKPHTFLENRFSCHFVVKCVTKREIDFISFVLKLPDIKTLLSCKQCITFTN